MVARTGPTRRTALQVICVSCPPKRSGRHRDGTPFPFDPTCKITRRGLCLLYQRIGAERMRDQLQYTDTQYPFDEEV